MKVYAVEGFNNNKIKGPYDTKKEARDLYRKKVANGELGLSDLDDLHLVPVKEIQEHVRKTGRKYYYT